MRLLILGGTRFVGRHLADAVLAAGHELTLFNRGQSDPGRFPEAHKLVGDRDGGLEALEGGEWDVVVDVSGYVPRIVRASAELLADRVGRYVFISTVSVYADTSSPGLTEDGELIELSDPSTEDVSEHYGGLKALCEREVRAVYGERATIVRPGVIVGPHDPTDRFTRWVTQIAAGGSVTAPEPRTQPVQVIDARDLADFVVQLADGSTPGTFNVVGDSTDMETMLTTIRTATGSDAELHWTSEGQLLEQGVRPWQDLPLWLAPASNPSTSGMLAMSNALAKAHGLMLRPLADSVRATLAAG